MNFDIYCKVFQSKKLEKFLIFSGIVLSGTMNVLSDLESSDSDKVRYKTESIRYKKKKKQQDIRNRYDFVDTNSPSQGCSKSKTRSRERDLLKRSRSPGKNNRKYDKIENTRTSSKSLKQHESHSKYEGKEDKDGNRYSNNNSSSRSVNKEKCSPIHKKSRSRDIDEKKCDNEKYKKDKRDKYRLKSACSNIEIKMGHSSNKFHSPMGNEIQAETNASDNLVCGPSLPPHMLKTKQDNESLDYVSHTSTKRTYGPNLPGIFTVNNEKLQSDDDNDEPKPDDKHSVVCDSEDEILIGPILEVDSRKNQTFLELEKRAVELKLAKLNERKEMDVQKREEWMTSLPELRTVADLGVTARQFRTKVHDEIKDRSIWTETPRDREDKEIKRDSLDDNMAEMNQKKIEKLNCERRDAEQEDMIRKHKKKHKRNESLLKIHQKNMKPKAGKETVSERRPFSRDEDLKVNRFDQAMKNSILKKAQLLDTRFSSGQAKFL